MFLVKLSLALTCVLADTTCPSGIEPGNVEIPEGEEQATLVQAKPMRMGNDANGKKKDAKGKEKDSIDVQGLKMHDIFETNPVADDTIGNYVIHGEGVMVTNSFDVLSIEVAQLSPGQVVKILNVVRSDDDRLVRGLVEAPAGWITLHKYDDIEWAVKVDSDDKRERLLDGHLKTHHPSKLGAFYDETPGKYVIRGDAVKVTRSTDVLSDEVGVLSAGQVVHVLRVVPRINENHVSALIEEPAGWIILRSSDKASWAEKVDTTDEEKDLISGYRLKMHEIPETTELPETEPTVVDTPGKYMIHGGVILVTHDVDFLSHDIAVLSAGQLVNVLEVVRSDDDRLVRGRIEKPAGWITLHKYEDDTLYSLDKSPWAEKVATKDEAKELFAEKVDTKDEEKDSMRGNLETSKAPETPQAAKIPEATKLGTAATGGFSVASESSTNLPPTGVV